MHGGFVRIITYEVMLRMHKAKYNNPRKKKKNSFLFLRLFLCTLAVVGAIALKQTNAPFFEKISEVISREFEVDKAIEVISAKLGEEDGVAEVFKEEEKENKTETDYEDFYIGEIEKELAEEKEKIQEEKMRESVETLSFTMSEEETFDDTAAEPFRIPPPSYCSYKKEKISFKFTSPLSGVITSKFGYRDHPIVEDASFHTGLDIAAKRGKAIGSFAAGKVIEAGKNATYGNYLLIEHPGGFRSFYGHNSKLCVKKGQKVTIGQKIAEVGSTGMSTGPHLHFEVRKGNVRLDPDLYI